MVHDNVSPWLQLQVEVGEELLQPDGSAHQISPAHGTFSQLRPTLAADQVAATTLEHGAAGFELVVTNL